ncbi:MAG TPA: hypothetical protein VKB16_25730, partial [Beijerinckiaceae bacterium]|nr:hypothetical protein [Beijerinckiaceae bacterium]
HDTDLNKTECFLNTTDPRGLFTGSGQSNWCGTRFIATLSADFTASARRVRAGPVKHDSEKWLPVFGKDHAQTKR